MKRKSTSIMVVILAFALVLILFTACKRAEKAEVEPYTVNLGKVVREYVKRAYSIEGGESFSWYSLSEASKCEKIIFNEKEYHSRGFKLNDNQTGKLIGKDERKRDVFNVKDISTDFAVAVNFDDGYYIYVSDSKYLSFKTLGEFLGLFDFYNNADLIYFRTIKDYASGDSFYIEDDSKIIDVLKTCENSPIETDYKKIDDTAGEAIDFYLMSKNLPLYGSVLTITSGGYLRTDNTLFFKDFYIGKEKAEKIISLVKSEGVKAEIPEKYYCFSGEVKEINESEAVLSDSLLLKNPDEGLDFKIEFKSKTEKDKFSEHIRTGDIVKVYYADIKENVLLDPVAVYEATLDEKLSNPDALD